MFGPEKSETETSVVKGIECENPLLDARGRPVFIEMRHGELSRKLMLDRTAGELDGLDGPS